MATNPCEANLMLLTEPSRKRLQLQELGTAWVAACLPDSSKINQQLQKHDAFNDSTKRTT